MAETTTPLVPANYGLGTWTIFLPANPEPWQQSFKVEKDEQSPHIINVTLYGKKSQMYQREFAYLLSLMLAQEPDGEDPIELNLKQIGLPCEIVVGDNEHVFKKGSPLQTLVTQARYWYGMMKASTGKAYQYDVEHPNDGLNATKDG